MLPVQLPACFGSHDNDYPYLQVTTNAFCQYFNNCAPLSVILEGYSVQIPVILQYLTVAIIMILITTLVAKRQLITHSHSRSRWTIFSYCWQVELCQFHINASEFNLNCTSDSRGTMHLVHQLRLTIPRSIKFQRWYKIFLFLRFLNTKNTSLNHREFMWVISNRSFRASFIIQCHYFDWKVTWNIPDVQLCTTCVSPLIKV